MQPRGIMSVLAARWENSWYGEICSQSVIQMKDKLALLEANRNANKTSHPVSVIHSNKPFLAQAHRLIPFFFLISTTFSLEKLFKEQEKVSWCHSDVTPRVKTALIKRSILTAHDHRR